MPNIVVNSTPLIALAKVERLDLLKELYGRVRVPEAVWLEVNAKDDDAAQRIRSCSEWIEITRCERMPDVASLMPARLHAGEVECIMLARSTGADFILLDDNAAKKTAEYLGFRVIGTLGVLVTAKRAGLIDAVGPVLDELLAVGFYVSDRVLEMVRRSAGE